MAGHLHPVGEEPSETGVEPFFATRDELDEAVQQLDHVL